MSVKKKRTIGPCRGVTWLYYVVLLWLRDFFLSLYLDPRFRPLLLKLTYYSDFGIVAFVLQPCIMSIAQATGKNLTYVSIKQLEKL